MLISDIQRALAALGYDPGPVDGYMGPRTQKAVRAFQAANHLAVDGVVGPVTQEALQSPAGPAGKAAGPAQPAPKASRFVDTLVVHCTASAEGTDLTVAQIRAMHKAQGWADIGYHWIIRADGTPEAGRPEGIIGAHVEGHNTGSIGISYVGGLARGTLKAKDTRTGAQKAALRDLLADLVARYPIRRIVGHRDLSPDRNGNGLVEPDEWVKMCPCFDAVSDYRRLLVATAA